MKRIFSLFLALFLTLGLCAILPAVRAEEILPADLGQQDNSGLVDWFAQDFGCVPAEGGEVRASELEPGVSYVFRSDVDLILDADLTTGVLAFDGGLTIRGDAVLTADVVYASSSLTVESGTVVCPVMDNPPEPYTTIHNGLTGIGGVCFCGGSVICPDVSAGGETVSVSGGEVCADTIFGMFGYSQSGGTVDTGGINAREGFSISGGRLTVGSIFAEFCRFSGGVTEVRSLISIYGPEEPAHKPYIRFPMTISEPAGAVWNNGRFEDAEGNPVKKVRIEPIEIDHSFTDVDEGAYYYDGMLWAWYYGIAQGADETHFAPKKACTRAEIVTFLWRAAGSPEPETDLCPFRDIAADAYYYKAVLWAVEQGVTTGKSDTVFAPKQTCTRAQIVTFLWRSQGSPEPGGGKLPFTDVPRKAFYYQAVCWAQGEGIASGTSWNRFSPYRTCTRGQAVTFLMRTFG